MYSKKKKIRIIQRTNKRPRKVKKKIEIHLNNLNYFVHFHIEHSSVNHLMIALLPKCIPISTSQAIQML